MRLYHIILLALPLFAVDNTQCNKAKNPATCLKGKLEIKGICSNYVITITQGNFDPSKVAASWTDPESNKTYKNAFKLGSPCTFPTNLDEGDEFYFEFVPETRDECTVCMAYRPVPEQINMIRVLGENCNAE